jgi:N-acetylglucosaminyldiphosphoundecaprenol N-acetyl-beta-D-mannosaminyltransferase
LLTILIILKITENLMESVSVCGLKVNDVTMEQTLESIDRMVSGGGSHLVVTLGVEMVMRTNRDREFIDIVNNASLVVPDSVGIQWAGRKAGGRFPERVTGIDILTAAARQNEYYKWKVFFLGAKPGVAEEAAENMKRDYPEFRIVGTHHGYFDNDEEIIDKIKSADINVLFIALGSPYQEKWFMKNRERLGNIVALGVGGSFDVISGTVRRAPVFMRKLGLEWFYRLVTQPARFGRMLALPRFAIRILLKGV